jgi:hypothetical protein
MGTRELSYCFTLAEGRRECIELCIDENTLENKNRPTGPLPAWTQLAFCQCPHCPLDSAEQNQCPVAVSLVEITGRFAEIVSFAEVAVTVVSKERIVSHQTTAQRAMSSLLGLLFVTSGCPHTRYFKPMAFFHLPLATERDTIFRVAGMYLLAQYFRGSEGMSHDPELAGLATIYDNLHLVNVGIAARLRSALTSDSSINAVIILDMFTKALPFVIQENLLEIRYLFAPYFSEEYQRILDALTPETPPL